MKLRLKILLLGAVPLLLALAAIMGGIYVQGMELAKREKALVEQALLSSKESELRHYVSLAYSAIEPLLAQGDDPATRQRALALLASMEFGQDGYFFVYDLNGRNLMHPRQPELVGRELWDMRDAKGDLVIQQLLATARRGGREGHTIRYLWEKPSLHQSVEKLGYVAVVEPWGWMLGTGIYLDDVAQTLADIDAAAQNNVRNMFGWIAGIAALGTLLVALWGLALNIRDHREADAKLRRMARQLVHSQEEERARLSRELHDGISQVLVSIKLLLEAARERVASLRGADPDALAMAQKPMDGALERLNGAVGEIRRISHNLRPTLLDDLGLPAALEHLGREFSAQRQAAGEPLQVVQRTTGKPVRLPSAGATALFRITQEALTNIQRHAGATRVDLDLAYSEEGVSLSVADNGVGFDHAAVQLDPLRGIGLRNMHERMASLAGHVAIRSDRGGTIVQAWLPLQAEGAAT
ncbi:histidine kinase [Pigmentiphaga sp. NML080357]|uniref:cache domain-containing protein n=1 Tax=Pigmentiphaga sp. NML080357 TaxID=2008675 RepID=UPI000B41D4FD|nr:cache domain-containing protein [Pigmentiphaga sp. NML080357]OVZ59153.1 histidine kinase [Pigmentiphaga sp. NML080357]